jgi:hypothetical protein
MRQCILSGPVQPISGLRLARRIMREGPQRAAFCELLQRRVRCIKGRTAGPGERADLSVSWPRKLLGRSVDIHSCCKDMSR